ncbi:LURP-one-related/scramblase family protein [Thalassomonas sp. M1454]|uniref:LURP-one-related/scramblase family protein n=1 Tax=Thalassomonas sp. M1454 TaxID=2594477 RepID=UPI00117CE1D5|nr:LURP-one-related family protein [Thalassomonas sp. M1454]TRX53828.1 hypothetical protein FNN08_12780 [Thalassomonas sp. M1454]
MATFKLKQKFLSITEKFEIKNEQDEIVYLVEGKFFSIGKRFTLFDNKENVLAEIKQKLLSFRPQFHILLNDGSHAQIIKTFLPLFSSRFLVTIDQPGAGARELEITGNFLSHEYSFTENGQVLAQVSKEMFSFRDTYGLEVHDESLNEIIVSLLIVIDAIHHGNDKN